MGWEGQRTTTAPTQCQEDSPHPSSSSQDFGHNHDTGPAWEAAFVATYVAFLKNLTVWHGSPSLPLFLGMGPLTKLPVRCVQEAVAQFTALGGNATFVNVDDGKGGDGCYGHPGPAGHELMFEFARPVIAAILGWD